MAFSLDDRLAMCAGLVRRGARVADIGTDHAYLPVYLCGRGICPSAIAADINPAPLESGRQTIKEAGLEAVIEARLCNGLEAVGRDEADDIIIAGMGGELIADIIEAWRFSRDGGKRFILQPMTKSEVLIRRLYENGFEILERDCCAAHGKCYTVMLVRFCGEKKTVDEAFCFAGMLRPRDNELHKRFIEEHIARLDKMAKGDVRFAALAQRLGRMIYEDN